MHEDIVVSNGVWKFVGNPELVCQCMSGKNCIQFPERKIETNPFLQLKDSATKLCVRVWKFHSYKTCECCGEAKKDVTMRPSPFFKICFDIESEMCLCDNCEKEIM